MFTTTAHVSWFSEGKGYGFIKLADGRECFAHYSAIENEGYKILKENQTVVVDVIENRSGLQAKRIFKVSE